MSAYIYRTSPSLIATALVRRADGTVEQAEIALYKYAYKPSNWDQNANRRWAFRTGCVASETAYDRAGRNVPALGISFDGDANEVYALRGTEATYKPYLTKGSVLIHDDYVQSSDVEIISWVKLPKGIKSKAAKGVAAA